MWIAGEPVIGACAIGCEVKKLGIPTDTVDDTDRANGRRLRNFEQQRACHRKGLARHHDDRAFGMEFSMLQHDAGRQDIVAASPRANLADKTAFAVVVPPCGQPGAELGGWARGAVEITHDGTKRRKIVDKLCGHGSFTDTAGRSPRLASRFQATRHQDACDGGNIRHRRRIGTLARWIGSNPSGYETCQLQGQSLA